MQKIEKQMEHNCSMSIGLFRKSVITDFNTIMCYLTPSTALGGGILFLLDQQSNPEHSWVAVM